MMLECTVCLPANVKTLPCFLDIVVATKVSTSEQRGLFNIGKHFLCATCHLC